MTARRLKKNKRWGFIKFCFFFYMFISVFVLIWLRIAVVKLEYELGQLREQKTALLKDGKLISAERANLYSVGKIEEVAIKQLGMTFPKREKIFFVKRVTVATPHKASVKEARNGR